MIQSAIVWRLGQETTLTDLLGNTGGAPWIFQNTFQASPEGRGEAAVVVYQSAAWTPPPAHHTNETPRVVIDVEVDPTKSSAMITKRDGEVRALAIHKVIRGILHLQDGSVVWNGVRILGISALTEPTPIALPPEAGEMKILRSAYGAIVG